MADRRKLTTNPLTLTEGVTLQVDDVYVPLGLVERKKLSKRQDDVSPEQGSELYKETEITKTFENKSFLEEVIEQNNTPKSKGKRIAIIGEPGAGKTTLLQQIAYWVSREIHQSIVIWVSLADLRGKELTAYLFETWLTQVAEKTGKAEATKQLKDDFVALFNQNNVWLLLDGLDEMSTSSSNPLTEFARQFREARAISQARIVLTCRVNLWDGSINALDDFDTYRTLDFSYLKDVEGFIDKWFNKIEIPDTGKQLCTALKNPGKERIQDLVKNPLRLTLLCLNWQSGNGKLPDTQAGLYQQFVDDFYKWKKDEFATTSDQRQQLNIKLGELAKAAIDKEATRFRLRQDFVNRFLGDVDDDNSLLKLALNRGWLNSIGIDEQRKPVYAFFHASFQEYFAAKAIDDWHFFLNHVPKNPSKGTYRIFEPQWKQTILLWLGREEKKLKQQKQQFIDALVKFKDGYGEWNIRDVDKGFYGDRAYFLAAAVIGEFNDYGQTNEIVDNIVKWTINNCLLRKDDRTLRQEMPRTKTIDILVEHLLNLADDLANKPKEIRFYYLNNLGAAIFSLEKIAIGNEKAINALIKLFHSKYVTEDESCLHKVVMALNQICTFTENNINALLTFGESQGYNRYKLIQIIEELRIKSREDKQIIGILINMIKPEDMYYYNHGQTEYRLREVQNNPVMNALVQLLKLKCVSDKTIAEAASKLVKNEPNNQIGIDALVELLELADVDTDIHRLAAYSLRTIELGNQKAIDALVRRLQLMDADEDTLCEVVNSLGYIGKGNKKAIDDLAKLLDLKNLDDYTCRLVADSLGKIDPGNQKAIDALANLLASEDMDENMLRLVAENLGKIDPGNEKALETLIKLLDSTDENNGIYWLVPDSLKQILQKNQLKSVVTKLTSNLNSSQLSNYIYQDVLKHCAQNMNYPDFYNAWNWNQGKDKEVSVNSLNSIQCLQSAINDDSQLSQKIHFICIDTSKFIVPDNPASKIYTTIVKAGCPKCEDGTPKTMAELQTYWELLETDKRVVLVFHPSATNTTDEVKYSDRFLSDISKFEGAICFMSNPIPNHNTLKFFPPSQPIDVIVEWLRRS